MPVKITDWLVEGKVIMSVGYGEMTFDDFMANNNRIKALLEEGQAPVHIIMDARAINSIRLSLKEIKAATDFGEHPKTGYVIGILTYNKFLLMLSNILHQVRRNKGRFVGSYAEALAMLDFDPTLPMDQVKDLPERFQIQDAPST